MDFIQEVFDYMVKNNLTQKEIATVLNITRNYLGQLLKNKYKPSKRLIRKFEILKETSKN